jgi:CubicO group peptidase (beta-lactamase class C family)
VAHFAEEKTGQPFEQLALHYVFDAIGMKDTSYTPQPWWTGRQAKPVESEARTKWSAADLLRTTVSDYAKFVVSVMRNEQVSPEIAAQPLAITRNPTSRENEVVLCEAAADPEHCKVSTGFGLSWHIVKINGEVIVDHIGGDSDVKTFAFFIPQRQLGAVIFTNGLDVGHPILDKIPAQLYLNPVTPGRFGEHYTSGWFGRCRS